MGTVTKIALDQNINKTCVVYVKFDDSQAVVKAIEKCTDNYAGENSAVPIQPVLARITVRSGKQSSPELQRLQFPITLAWTSTVHKVLGLTLNEVVVSAMLCWKTDWWNNCFSLSCDGNTLLVTHIN